MPIYIKNKESVISKTCSFILCTRKFEKKYIKVLFMHKRNKYWFVIIMFETSPQKIFLLRIIFFNNKINYAPIN